MNNYRQERFRQLRSSTLSTGQGINSKVYIKRGVVGVKGRSIVNGVLLVEKLEKDGYIVIEPEKMKPAEIVDACKNARVTLGVDDLAA